MSARLLSIHGRWSNHSRVSVISPIPSTWIFLLSILVNLKKSNFFLYVTRNALTLQNCLMDSAVSLLCALNYTMIYSFLLKSYCCWFWRRTLSSRVSRNRPTSTQQEPGKLSEFALEVGPYIIWLGCFSIERPPLSTCRNPSLLAYISSLGRSTELSCYNVIVRLIGYWLYRFGVFRTSVGLYDVCSCITYWKGKYFIAVWMLNNIA